MIQIYGWEKYLIIENEFLKAKKYVDITEANFEVTSLFFSNQVILLGSEIEAAFKMICSLNNVSGGNIEIYKVETLKTFPKIYSYFTQVLYTDYKVFPFDDWKQERCKLDWWEVYVNVKHSIVDEKANLKIALCMLSALQLLLILIEAKRHSVKDSNGNRSAVLFQNENPNLLIPTFNRTSSLRTNGVYSIFLIPDEEIA